MSMAERRIKRDARALKLLASGMSPTAAAARVGISTFHLYRRVGRQWAAYKAENGRGMACAQ